MTWDGVERRRHPRYKIPVVAMDLASGRDVHVAYIVSRDNHLVGLIIGAKSIGIPYREGKIARIKPEKRTSPTDWVEERRV